MPVTRAMAKGGKGGGDSAAKSKPPPPKTPVVEPRKRAKVKRTAAAATTEPTPPLPSAAAAAAAPTTKSNSPKPSTSTATATTRRNVKAQNKTKAQTATTKSTYPGKQPTLFNDSTSDEEVFEVAKKNNFKENKNPVPTTKTKHCCVPVTPTDYVPPASRVPPMTGTNNKKAVAASVLKEKEVVLPPPPPAAADKGKKVVEKGGEQLKKQEQITTKGVVNVVPEGEFLVPALPIQPTTSTQTGGGHSLRPRGQNKKAIVKKRGFVDSELAGVVGNPYVLASQCRIVGAGLESAFQKLEGIDLKKRGEAIISNLTESIRQLRVKRENEKEGRKNDKVTDSSTEAAVNTLNSSLKSKPSRPNSSTEAAAVNTSNSSSTRSKSLKRARTNSFDEEHDDDEEEPGFEFDNRSKKDGSIDMFEPEIENKKKVSATKLSFNFVVAAEKESIPIQASKKIILDPTGQVKPIITKNRGSSSSSLTQKLKEVEEPQLPAAKPSKPLSDATFVKPAVAVQSTEEDEDGDDEEDVLESSCLILDDDDSDSDAKPKLQVQGADKIDKTKNVAIVSGQVFAPDLTYVNRNPNETFVKDADDAVTGSNNNKTGPLNKTVSLQQSGSYGKHHIPQFQDFSNSRLLHISTLDILEEEEDADGGSPVATLPKSTISDATFFVPPPAGVGNNKDNNSERKKKDKTSTSSSSSSSSYKSAVSHQIPPVKKAIIAPSALMNAKKYDAIKKKEEDAQRNKQANLDRIKEMQKKKNEEWKQKADKIKQDQQKAATATATTTSTSVKKINAVAPSVFLHKQPFFMNKPPRAPGPPNCGPPPVTSNLVSVGVNRMMMMDGFSKASGPMKTFNKQLVHSSKSSPLIPPASSYANLNSMKSPPPSKTMYRALSDGEVFKTPGGHNISFLDQTSEFGPGNSYDITLYEDLDEDMNHRQGKVVPDWAQNKNQTAISLLKQIGCGEIKGIGFPFPPVPRGYRLFDNRFN